MEKNKKQPKVFKPYSYFSTNLAKSGRKGLSLEDLKKLGGGYNPLLQSFLPEEFQIYKPSEETEYSSHRAFTTTFFPSWLFCGYPPSLLQATTNSLQVQALGLHGGPLQTVAELRLYVWRGRTVIQV
ncbi:unnamed protein product [Prunus armeniaca]|uniref:Uncharacterized protein n=1 Tax=Prunus armeniaca TaxID=36596 RepID=A0A6J5Y5I1_PRUAR|nr:unnamed protein product [Prunus armeniaca]